MAEIRFSVRHRTTWSAITLVALMTALLACAPQSPVSTPLQASVAVTTQSVPSPRPFPVATQSPALAAPAILPLTATATPLALALPTDAIPTGLATPEPPDRTQIALVAMLDYARHHLAVTETITYTNRTGEPLAELLLVAEPNRWPGAFRLNDLRWGNDQPVAEHQLRGGELALPLPEPLPPGDSVHLALVFELHVPQQLGPFGCSERGWFTNRLTL